MTNRDEKIKEVQKLLKDGLSPNEAASSANISEASVYDWKKKGLITFEGKTEKSAAKRQLVADLTAKGFSMEKIAHETGFSYGLIAYYRHENKKSPLQPIKTKRSSRRAPSALLAEPIECEPIINYKRTDSDKAMLIIGDRTTIMVAIESFLGAKQ